MRAEEENVIKHVWCMCVCVLTLSFRSVFAVIEHPIMCDNAQMTFRSVSVGCERIYPPALGQFKLNFIYYSSNLNLIRPIINCYILFPFELCLLNFASSCVSSRLSSHSSLTLTNAYHLNYYVKSVMCQCFWLLSDAVNYYDFISVKACFWHLIMTRGLRLRWFLLGWTLTYFERMNVGIAWVFFGFSFWSVGQTSLMNPTIYEPDGSSDWEQLHNIRTLSHSWSHENKRPPIIFLSGKYPPYKIVLKSMISCRKIRSKNDQMGVSRREK